MTEKTKTSGKVKTSEIIVPDKLYFRIGEVARLCHQPAYVLRIEAKTTRHQDALPFPAAHTADLKRMRHELKEILGILSAKHSA